MEKLFDLLITNNPEVFDVLNRKTGKVHFTVTGLEKNAAEQLVGIINEASVGIPENEKRKAIKNEQEVNLWRATYAVLYGEKMEDKDIVKCLNGHRDQMEYLKKTKAKLKQDLETANQALEKLEEYRQQAIKELTDIRTFVNADPNESTYDEVVRMKSLMEKEVIDDMERMRRNLWAETAVRVAGSSNTIKDETPTKYADRVLADFDDRFNKI